LLRLPHMIKFTVMIEKEQLQHHMVEANSIPYNTGAGVLRMAGVEYDPRQFGSDCFGKLNVLKQIPELNTIQFIESDFKGIRHIAGIIDQFYIDQFVFLAKPIDLAEVWNTGATETQTEALNQFVLARRVDGNELTVGLYVKKMYQYPEKCLLAYSYDLDNTKSTVDLNFPVTKLSQKWTLHILYNGIHIRGIFDAINDRWAIFPVNVLDCELDRPVEMLFEEALDVRHNNSLRQFEMYFREAHEAEKYVLYWQQKNT
jgi:hypothetical protein